MQRQMNSSYSAHPLRRNSLDHIAELAKPNRPTSLAPSVESEADPSCCSEPPETPKPAVALTPLLASLDLHDISHFSPEQLSSIEQRAQEIVQREVPQAEASTAVEQTVHPDVRTPDIADTTICPRQRLLFPLNPVSWLHKLFQ